VTKTAAFFFLLAAVKAASAIEEEPQLNGPYGDYSDLIESEVADAGSGHGAELRRGCRLRGLRWG